MGSSESVTHSDTDILFVKFLYHRLLKITTIETSRYYKLQKLPTVKQLYLQLTFMSVYIYIVFILTYEPAVRQVLLVRVCTVQEIWSAKVPAEEALSEAPFCVESKFFCVCEGRKGAQDNATWNS